MPGLSETGPEDVRFMVLRGNPQKLDPIPDRSVHLVVTAPPAWPVHRSAAGASGFGAGLDYPAFLNELEGVLREVFRLLVPGGRMVCIASDIWLSRRSHGRHQVIPFAADIGLCCRKIGFDHLTPVIWHRPAGRRTPAFLGKPYEPNGGIPSDTAVMLMQRKPGGYRKPTAEQRRRSRIERDRYRKWFQQVWTAVADPDPANGPVPVEIAERLIRMFSYWGDTVMDPFCGPGTVLVAALNCNRSGIGIEDDPETCRIALNRIHEASNPLFNTIRLACKPVSELDNQELSARSHDRTVSRPERRNSKENFPNPD